MATIVTKIALNDSGLEAGLAKVKNQLHAFSEELINPFAAWASGAVLAGAATEELKKLAEQAKAISEASEKFGVDAEKFQTLANAAQRAGVDTGSFDTALTKLARNAEEAVRGNEQLRASFAEAGISVDDLKSKDIGQVFLQYADAIHEGKIKGDEFALTLQLLGRGAGNLIPLFQKGGAVIEEMGRKGLIMTKEEIEQLTAAQLKWMTFTAALERTFLSIVNGLAMTARLMKDIAALSGAFGSDESQKAREDLTSFWNGGWEHEAGSSAATAAANTAAGKTGDETDVTGGGALARKTAESLRKTDAERVESALELNRAQREAMIIQQQTLALAQLSLNTSKYEREAREAVIKETARQKIAAGELEDIQVRIAEAEQERANVAAGLRSAQAIKDPHQRQQEVASATEDLAGKEAALSKLRVQQTDLQTKSGESRLDFLTKQRDAALDQINRLREMASKGISVSGLRGIGGGGSAYGPDQNKVETQLKTANQWLGSINKNIQALANSTPLPP